MASGSVIGGEPQPAGASASAEAAPPVTADSASKPLQSLTPHYDATQHETYLRRLEQAVRDPRNRNIALTGRYGAGKSSVLDQFEANHGKTTQRLAISTLAPGEEGETTTNRIQKEIVKQLLYGASKKVGKSSRFSKIAVLSKRRAAAESVVVVGCAGALLYLLGWLPAIKWTGAGETTSVRVATWIGATVLATLAVSVLRIVTFGRFLSDVSAGGAGLTLADKPDTFFDKYLDEIVHYFSREAKDIVIFEDLDRFEDPHIFEALRELNVILNETPERRSKRRGNRLGRLLHRLLSRLPGDVPAFLSAKLLDRWATRILGLGTPLRFVYAVKDSVFERIDAATANATWTGIAKPSDSARTTAQDTLAALADGGEGEGGPADRPFDAAAAETLRANRTKFFDIVIPLVPFISHRTARDLLLELLAQRGITGIDRRLVNTVAQHSTDMRLLVNICNEYLVFAERLLETDRTAPGMDESHLFALIAYKNFHLEDFENITRRDSDLDRLYDFHLRLVRGSIAAAEDRKRALLARRGDVQTRARDAERLGQRLRRYAGAELRAVRQPYSGWQHTQYRVGSKLYGNDDTTNYPFWTAVARAQSITVLGAQTPTGGQTTDLAKFVDREDIEIFFPECLDAGRWGEYDAKSTQAELAKLEQDMELLRRADFKDLAAMPAFTLPTPASEEPPGAEAPRTFEELLTATLKSQLAHDLVRRGYVDRNFSLYAAQFYGRFTGVDVANFMVQHVQTNTMAIDYDLSRHGAVANLLAEADDAGEELLHSVAAYNIDIVNHLLLTDKQRSDDVIDHIIASGPDDDARSFLAAYFTSENAQRDMLAARLAAHRWRDVFSFLIQDESVPADVRPALVSAALCAFEPDGGYSLGEAVRDFITAHYRDMKACTGPHPARDSRAAADAQDVTERVAAALIEAGVIVPELSALDEHLRPLVVGADAYELSADNLRVALGFSGDVSLDNVQQNQIVFDRCLTDLPAYLAAVGDDAATSYAVRTSASLLKVLADLTSRFLGDEHPGEAEDQFVNDLVNLLAAAAPAASLRSLRDAPELTWSALADADLFRSSLANIEVYRAKLGSIDAHLTTLLDHSGVVHVDEPYDATAQDGTEWDREAAAIAILNATGLTTATRVALVASVDAPQPLPVDDITPESSDLFALLLNQGIVADDDKAFAHFHAGGWAAIRPAIVASANIGDFIKPALVEGMVGDLLADPGSSAKVARAIVSDLDEYVPDDDWAALKAAGRYADVHQIALPPDTVLRIARVGGEHSARDVETTLRLLAAAAPTPSADQVVEAFTLLGPPYTKITRPGEKLKVPYDATHDQLLAVLRAAGRIARNTPRGRRYYGVTVSDPIA